VVRAIDRGQWQAPLGSSRGPTIRLLAACRRARVRQGQAFGGAEEAPSLTAAARDGDANMRSGRKNACGAGRTKEWNGNFDGVEPDGKGGYLVTDWVSGGLFQVAKDGKPTRLHPLTKGSADLGVGPDGIIMIQMMMDGTVVAYIVATH